MVNKIVHWFSLERPKQGGVTRDVILFTGVVAGTVGQWAFASVQVGKFGWHGLVLGLIASIVTFPVIYYNAGLNQNKLSFVKWCVAFQNGFFWPAILGQIAKGFK
ncbi:MAG TPA: hypothetical protein VK582_08530 [Pyrinomonadaceae bacterium]|nr:hypothetical protein [Pyrinomonadaceae bacterium]